MALAAPCKPVNSLAIDDQGSEGKRRAMKFNACDFHTRFWKIT